MSAPAKKQLIDVDENSNDDSDDNMGEESQIPAEIVQVDFEGSSPSDADFHGIKLLLQQLFLNSAVDLSELTNIIIGQNNIGSVVKQSGAGELNADDDDDDSQDIFSVTSVINLNIKRELQCIVQLRTLLANLSNKYATQECSSTINTLLSDKDKALGLIINERFVNIPTQMAVPVLETLSEEIRKACKKNQPFSFTHYIFICKLLKSTECEHKKESKKKQVPEILWLNQEEELIDEMADLKFEFCIKDEFDSSDSRCLDSDTHVAFRKVLIMSADKLQTLIQKVRRFVER